MLAKATASQGPLLGLAQKLPGEELQSQRKKRNEKTYLAFAASPQDKARSSRRAVMAYQLVRGSSMIKLTTPRIVPSGTRGSDKTAAISATMRADRSRVSRAHPARIPKTALIAVSKITAE